MFVCFFFFNLYYLVYLYYHIEYCDHNLLYCSALTLQLHCKGRKNILCDNLLTTNSTEKSSTCKNPYLYCCELSLIYFTHNHKIFFFFQSILLTLMWNYSFHQYRMAEKEQSISTMILIQFGMNHLSLFWTQTRIIYWRYISS